MSRRKLAIATRTLVLQRDRRHREPGVVGQQRDHAVDVIAGERGREPRRRPPAPSPNAAAAHAPGPAWAADAPWWPGPAAARCSPTPRCSRQHVRHLRRPEAEHVPEHEHRPLPRRQVLHRGDERQRDRLLGLVPRLRARRPSRAAPSSSASGIRLKPQRLAPPSRLGGHERRPGRLRPRPAAAGPQRVQAPVGRDPVQPGTQRRPALVADPARARPPAVSPAARPRRPAPNRGSGSSAAAARPGTGRSARRTPGRPRPRPVQHRIRRGTLLHPYGHRDVPESHRSASAQVRCLNQ